MKKSIVFCIILTLLFSASKSQDIIYKNDRTLIKCKIIKEGEDEIEYKKLDNLEGPLFSVPKVEVLAINYQTKTIINYDIIYKIDKTSIKAKVNKIAASEIEYKKYDNMNGPTYSILISDVAVIHYQNGSSDFFTTAPPQPKETPLQPPPQYNNKSNSNNQNPQYQSEGQNQTNAQPTNVQSATVKPASTQPDRATEDAVIVFKVSSDLGSLLDLEFDWKLYKGLYGGVSYYTDFSTQGGYYPYLAYKISCDKDKIFYVYANAGVNLSHSGEYYDDYGDYIPYTSSTSFLYEIGIEWYLYKHLGGTFYTSAFSSLWLGTTFRF